MAGVGSPTPAFLAINNELEIEMMALTKKTTKTTRMAPKIEPIHAGGGIIVDVAPAKPTPKAKAVYAGPSIESTRVLRKEMPEFKNCEAVAWMIVNTAANTITYANTYNGLLKASYRPEIYTYTLKEKVLEKKLNEYAEVEPTEWPSFVTPAAPAKAKRTRKAK